MSTYKHLSFFNLDIFSCKPEKWKEENARYRILIQKKKKNETIN